jgi:hypothetical protein
MSAFSRLFRRPAPGAADERQILGDLVAGARSIDADLDDAGHDGAGARPPTGDDYNALLGLIDIAESRLAAPMIRRRAA